MPRPAPMSKSIEEKASAFLLLAVGLEAAGGMRSGDSDDEEVDNVVAAIDGDETLFGGAPMPCVAVASVAVAPELLLFIGAPVAPPPRRDDDEPPPGERDRPARPASGSPAGAIDFFFECLFLFFVTSFFSSSSLFFFFTQRQALPLLLQLLLHRSSRAPRPSCTPSRC